MNPVAIPFSPDPVFLSLAPVDGGGHLISGNQDAGPASYAMIPLNLRAIPGNLCAALRNQRLILKRRRVTSAACERLARAELSGKGFVLCPGTKDTRHGEDLPMVEAREPRVSLRAGNYHE